MALKTYDPKKITLIVGGAIISGYADGTFVDTVRDTDTFTKAAGADGEVARVKQNDKSGSITITLMQTSDSNLVLSAIAALDELSNTGVVPTLLKDLSGTTLVTAARSWISKQPATPLGKDVQNREWVLHTDELIQVVGGN